VLDSVQAHGRFPLFSLWSALSHVDASFALVELCDSTFHRDYRQETFAHQFYTLNQPEEDWPFVASTPTGEQCVVDRDSGKTGAPPNA
jgi:hypothetical protein